MRYFAGYLTMGNMIVSVLGPNGYSSALGKKGTSTDITLYDSKKGDDTISFIEPTRYPERLAPLFFSTSIAKKAIVVVDELNSTFGECVVMLQCSGISSGYFVLRNYVTKEKIEPLIKGTNLEKFEFVEDDPTFLREQLLTEAGKQKMAPEPEAEIAGTVPVDHAFNVKGVGTVVLGVVINGAIKKHDLLKVLPGTKTAQIRSIQKHDDEFDFATEGDRVGLALKNIAIEDLERGTVLTTDTSIKSMTSLKTRANLMKYWPTPIKEGMVLHVGHWMQFVPCKVEAISDQGDWRKPDLTLTLEKELVHSAGDVAVLTYLEGGKLRVAGTIKLP